MSHMSWGDVAIDNLTSSKLLQVNLKKSKTDQLEKGVEVFIGRTSAMLCPVVAVLTYMANQGSDHDQGPPLDINQFSH